MPVLRSTLPSIFSAAWILLLVNCFVGPAAARAGTGLVGLDGAPVDPFRVRGGALLAFVFARVDCPISNSYAPEVGRLHRKFAGRGVAFWLVYPEADEPADEIRQHLREFAYPCDALLDPRLIFTKRSKVRVTPEAALYRADGVLLYHGRLDDRYFDLGKARPSAARFDFEDALTQAVARQPVQAASGRAVGCLIEGLR